VQVTFDGGLAVAAVGGDRPGHAAGPAGDPLDGGRQLRPVRGSAVFDGIVQDDAVVVVGDLGFVPELDRPVDAALVVNTGFLVVGDPGGNSVSDGTCQVALYGNSGDGSVKLTDSSGRFTWYTLGAPSSYGG
jgi:hypothetical protein